MSGRKVLRISFSPLPQTACSSARIGGDLGFSPLSMPFQRRSVSIGCLPSDGQHRWAAIRRPRDHDRCCPSGRVCFGLVESVPPHEVINLGRASPSPSPSPAGPDLSGNFALVARPGPCPTLSRCMSSAPVACVRLRIPPLWQRVHPLLGAMQRTSIQPLTPRVYSKPSAVPNRDMSAYVRVLVPCLEPPAIRVLSPIASP